MRLRSILLTATLLLTTLPFTVVEAGVLVPADSKTQKDETPSLGLTPRATTQQPAAPTQQPQPQQTPTAQPQQPSATPAPQPKATFPIPRAIAIPTPDTALDSVNPSALQSVDIGTLRKSMPAEFKSMTDADLKKLVVEQTTVSRDDLINKYMKSDPQTGQSYIDFDQLARDKSLSQSKQTFAPGGIIASSKQLTARDKIAASLLAKGDVSGAVAQAKTPFRRKLPFMQKPPLIVPSKDLPLYGNATLKYALSTSVPKEFVWGQSDVSTVSEILGYNEQTIPQNCQIRLDTSVHTDDGKSLYNATILSGNTQKIGYNGVIKSVTARPYAVCNKPTTPLPESGMILFDYAGKYAVLLPETSCQISAAYTQSSDKPPSALIMQYAGDSKVTCTFVR